MDFRLAGEVRWSPAARGGGLTASSPDWDGRLQTPVARYRLRRNERTPRFFSLRLFLDERDPSHAAFAAKLAEFECGAAAALRVAPRRDSAPSAVDLTLFGEERVYGTDGERSAALRLPPEGWASLVLELGGAYCTPRSWGLRFKVRELRATSPRPGQPVASVAAAAADEEEVECLL